MYDVNKPPPEYPPAWKVFKWLLKALAVIAGLCALVGAVIWVAVASFRAAPVLLGLAFIVWLFVWADRRAPKEPESK